MASDVEGWIEDLRRRWDTGLDRERWRSLVLGSCSPLLPPHHWYCYPCRFAYVRSGQYRSEQEARQALHLSGGWRVHVKRRGVPPHCVVCGEMMEEIDGRVGGEGSSD